MPASHFDFSGIRRNGTEIEPLAQSLMDVSAGTPVRYVLARFPVRVVASIRKLPENSAVCARADDGRSCGRCGREAVVAGEDEEVTLFSKDALLDEGVPESDRASRNRPRRSNSRLRSGCNNVSGGWPPPFSDPWFLRSRPCFGTGKEFLHGEYSGVFPVVRCRGLRRRWSAAVAR